MFRHSTNTGSFFSILIAALIFSLSLAGVAAAQGNTSLGTGALQNNTTGSFNTASGVNALFSNTTGSLNTASGVNALFGNTIGDYNTASGFSALLSNTTGDFNTASGVNALFSNTTGSLNTASGVNALLSNTTGNYNIASGFSALFSNTTGSYNTASGPNALFHNTTGDSNTASGVQALLSNTTGDYNTASGFSALYSNTTGILNAASGPFALYSNTTGNNNTASGPRALFGNTTGNTNTALGIDAGRNLTTGSNNIAIGHPGVAGVGNRIWLGDPSIHTTTLLSGTIGIGTTNPTRAKVEISGTFGNWTGGPGQGIGSGGLFSFGNSTYGGASLYAANEVVANDFAAFSDERIKRKEGRSDAARDLETLARIEVTDYSYIDTTKGTGKHKKVIAQQVEKVYPEAVSTTIDVVPDIYKKAQVKDGWVSLATNLEKGERVRLIGKKNDGIHEVLEVAEGKFRTDFAADGDEVFVYGREVKDFRNVDYDAIAMLNVSATQELNRRLEKQAADFVAQAEEMSKQTTRIAELEQDRQAQAARIVELEKQASEIAMLKQQMAALQAAGLTAGRLDAAQLAAAR